MKTIFVAGTDTGVGKTVVTGLVAGYLAGKGYNVATQKWVATGQSDDIDTHIRFMGKHPPDFSGVRSAMAPYHFTFAASPHLAASLDGKAVSAQKIRHGLNVLSGKFDFIIIEGSGGLCVPLNRKLLMIDMVQKLKLPVLVVAANKLGAINHALLSLEALRSRKMRVIGTIFNNGAKEKKIILRDNPRIVASVSKTPVLGIVPHAKDPFALQKTFKEIGDKILEAL